MRKRITIDLKSCTTALQFLDKIGKELGTRISNFDALYDYLKENPVDLQFLNMNKFTKLCPQSIKRLNSILREV